MGLTRGTTRDHIIRAAQESIAYQVADLVDAMEKDTGIALRELNADGGASRDRFLMQFQADILNKSVCRPAIRETTALGAAYLAGLAVGVWRDLDQIRALRTLDQRYEPAYGGRYQAAAAARLAQGRRTQLGLGGTRLTWLKYATAGDRAPNPEEIYTKLNLDALFSIFRDEEANRFLPWYPLHTMEEARSFFLERYAASYGQERGYRYARLFPLRRHTCGIRQRGYGRQPRPRVRPS